MVTVDDLDGSEDARTYGFSCQNYTYKIDLADAGVSAASLGDMDWRGC